MQAKYVRNRAKGLRKKDAALEAGYSKTMAQAPINTIEKSAAVQNALEGFLTTLDRHVDDEKLAGKYAQWLDAKRSTKFGTEDDNMAQIKAGELISRMKGYLSSDKGDTNIQVNIQNVLD